MSDEELLRYSRHILLDEIGVEGQSRIANSKALVVGAGGLGGCPVALYLVSAGVGQLTLADNDTVDLTNLQRQILHNTARVGQPKVHSARAQLTALNPCVQLHTLNTRLAGTLLVEQVQQADVVLDCSDNFATRHAINRACVKFGKPLVSGAAIRFDGQLACFDLRQTSSPCYHCLFPEGDEVGEERCATMGVFAPLTGVIGALQAGEALKILGGFGTPVFGQLRLYDARTAEFRQVGFHKDPGCVVCHRH
ncbi:MAG: molybdopterin-synthase adenylyltransferase MoeB [Limnobacter sp.]|nr:molybdopterin-synthase adenylyltransferase MoeB [Limnobacter sp.]